MNISRKGLAFKIRWFLSEPSGKMLAQDSLCKFWWMFLFKLLFMVPAVMILFAIVLTLVISWELFWTIVGLPFGFRTLLVFEESRRDDVPAYLEPEHECWGMTWREIPYWPLRGGWRLLPITLVSLTTIVASLFIFRESILHFVSAVGVWSVETMPRVALMALALALAITAGIGSIKVFRAIKRSEIGRICRARYDALKQGVCPKINYV